MYMIIFSFPKNKSILTHITISDAISKINLNIQYFLNIINQAGKSETTKKLFNISEVILFSSHNTP